MHSVRIDPTFQSWRSEARQHLARATPPQDLLWEDGTTGADSLFADADTSTSTNATTTPRQVKIPREFLALAELVSCHGNPERWGVLYRAAFRLTHGGERHLLQLRIDDDVKRLEDWASAVRRDRHKMKAFVRFRKTGERTAEDGHLREQFVAWFEPEHRIVELTAPFFAKRFASQIGIDAFGVRSVCRCLPLKLISGHFRTGKLLCCNSFRLRLFDNLVDIGTLQRK